jgi:hypothetical protein
MALPSSEVKRESVKTTRDGDKTTLASINRNAVVSSTQHSEHYRDCSDRCGSVRSNDVTARDMCDTARSNDVNASEHEFTAFCKPVIALSVLVNARTVLIDASSDPTKPPPGQQNGKRRSDSPIRPVLAKMVIFRACFSKGRAGESDLRASQLLVNLNQPLRRRLIPETLGLFIGVAT